MTLGVCYCRVLRGGGSCERGTPVTTFTLEMGKPGPDPGHDPQKALSGGIPSSFLEPSPRSRSHFVGIYHQKLTKSSKNDF